MTLGELQNAIMRMFPDNKEQLLYIYDKTGSVIFKEKWKEFSLYDTKDAKEWRELYGIMMIMKTMDYNISEKSIITNFIFQQSIERLMCF